MSFAATTISNTVNYKFEGNVLDFVKSEIFDYKNFTSPLQFIDTAIKNYIQDREINEVLEASKRAKAGEVLFGDLDALAGKI